MLGEAVAGEPVNEAKAKKTVRRRKSQNLVLEPRVLFDGAPVLPPVDPAAVAAAAEGAKPAAEPKAAEPQMAAAEKPTSDSAPIESTAAPVPTEKNEALRTDNGGDLLVPPTPAAAKLVIISDSLTEAETLTESLTSSAEVVTIHADGDVLQQITDILASHQNLSELHIISHGEANALIFGKQVINTETLNQNAALLQSWQAALTDNADILLYGCDIGSTDQSVFLKTLQGLTAADIAASSDKTGDTALGGDAILEVQLGDVEATSLLSQTLLDQLDVLLVDTVPPVVQSAAMRFDGTNLTVTLQLNEAMADPTGASLVITVAGVDRIANYDSASSDLATNKLSFKVAISGEDQERGVTLGGIAANSATIRDAAGNSVTAVADLDNLLTSIDVGVNESGFWRRHCRSERAWRRRCFVTGWKLRGSHERRRPWPAHLGPRLRPLSSRPQPDGPDCG